MRQKVVVVVPEGGSLFEISTPIGIWGPDRGPIRDFDVDFVACGVENSDVTVSAGLALSGLGLLDDHLDDADLIIVPTWPILARPVPPSLSDRLERAHEQGSRIVGLCLGAFAVASTGLLDGLGAVTHWRYRDRFESMFPLVRFDPNTLYVDHESIVTSAGSAAAIDCCLHLVRRDHGAETAATIARSMVTAPHRSGAQSQFASAPPIPQGGDSLSRALAAAAENIGDIAGVDDLTALAATSRRSLERHMRERLGISPRGWIDEQRVITACRLLETTSGSIEDIARSAGFGSPPTLRRALLAERGVTPTAYRSMFHSNDGSC